MSVKGRFAESVVGGNIVTAVKKLTRRTSALETRQGKDADVADADQAAVIGTEGISMIDNAGNEVFKVNRDMNILQATGIFTSVVKTDFQQISANTTPQNDTMLKFVVEASKTYYFRARLLVNSDAAASTMDFKCGWSLPTDGKGGTATMHWGALALGGAGAGGNFAKYAPADTVPAFNDETSVQAFGLNGTTGFTGIALEGWVATNVGEAGTVNLQWAQNTSNPNNLIVNAGSFIETMGLF